MGELVRRVLAELQEAIEHRSRRVCLAAWTEAKLADAPQAVKDMQFDFICWFGDVPLQKVVS